MNERLRNPWVWAFLVGCAVVTSIRPLLRRVPAPPPVIGRMPSFILVSSAGERFESASLAGHVWVASFFFTRCAAACKERMHAVARLAGRDREEKLDSIRWLSITVDPEFDTPERLREAESAYGVDRERWLLLTGNAEQIHAIAEAGLGLDHALLKDSSALAEGGEGAQFFLVDGAGRLRGRYPGGAVGIDEIYWRSRRVAEEEKGR